MKKSIPLAGLVFTAAYIITFIVYICTKANAALTVYEIFTVIYAFCLLFVFNELADREEAKLSKKSLMLVFCGCLCAVTAIVHLIDVSLINKLVALGAEVKDYYKIGHWPSVLTAADYTAWGLFGGLAFICEGLSFGNSGKADRVLKTVLVICGLACVAGFIGAFFVHIALWYIAPAGFVAGIAVSCVVMLMQNGKQNKSE